MSWRAVALLAGIRHASAADRYRLIIMGKDGVMVTNGRKAAEVIAEALREWQEEEASRQRRSPRPIHFTGRLAPEDVPAGITLSGSDPGGKPLSDYRTHIRFSGTPPSLASAALAWRVSQHHALVDRFIDLAMRDDRGRARGRP